MNLSDFVVTFIAFLFFLVKPRSAGIQEIKYREQWTHDRFLQNELYDRQITEEDINSIPFPYLRSALIKRRQEKQGPIPFTIGFLMNLLFGGYQAAGVAAATTAAPDASGAVAGMAMTMPTPPNPNTYSGRTRRPTKYKLKGNCKNPPKKHPAESDDGDSSK